MSSSNNKSVKFFKNPEREHLGAPKPYVPQYQVHGVEPETYQSPHLSSNVKMARPSMDNPRVKTHPPIRQPYATPNVSVGAGPVPNVGNNMEHTWSSIDGEDLENESMQQSLDPNHPMIDNNDFVSPQSLGYQSGFTAADLQRPPAQGKITIEHVSPAKSNDVQRDSSEDNLLPILHDLAEDYYLLIVAGVPLCSGPKLEIQEQASALMFGEHEMCDGNPIPQDDIMILRKVPIKVGLFLE